ncbi:probable serine/threonine-protein kinase DDB_G0282963 isoform X2 [Condylostylus longicornis]|uniref:probable serine/threonine-protein kinase DDB_G0282963 isoform X2 n=1 Tax=Condylostylus longicornis TaxID=2530218 RepID=UPI00244DF6C7|nr:probable serine/threonine-protein kinase DDB_G0282963 isoform X2 [Condylostylus longicornis]
MKSKVWNKIFNKNKSSSANNSTTPSTSTTAEKECTTSSSNTNANYYEISKNRIQTSNDDTTLINYEHGNTLNDNKNFNTNKKHTKYKNDILLNDEINYLDLNKRNSIIKPGTSATLGRLNSNQEKLISSSGNCSPNKVSKISKMVNSFTLKRHSSKKKSACNPDVAISIIRSNESTKLFNLEKLNKRSNSDHNFNQSSSVAGSTTKTIISNSNDEINQFDNNFQEEFMINDNNEIKNSPTNNFFELPLPTDSDYIKPLNSFAYQTESIVMELKPCPICNRTFVPDKLEKHVKICEKWATQKRKVFDSSRQRREGTEMAAYLPKDFGFSTSKQCSPEIGIPLESKHEINSSATFPNQIIESKHHSLQQQQPQQIHHPLRQKSITSNNTLLGTKKSLSPTSRMTAAQIAEIKARAEAKRHIPPASEQCPECGRHFGIKAYDRHVEFCKEKSKIAQFKGNNTSQAKERLEARTKYRAPNLRLKRAAVRDKYSGNGDDAHDENRFDDFLSMSNSLSSSFMSDGGYSDKYDPFLSAKRQLEELCSPTSTTKTKFDEIKSPKTPLTPKTPLYSNIKANQHQILNSSTSSPMTSSYTGPSTTSSINPSRTLNAVKSNFRRTSSLRAPRKSTPSRPLFVPPNRSRPSTIQRGISDEGPISTNFIKPEEYDEMPVKSACINNFATSVNSPRLKRDASPRPRLLSNSSRESSPKTLKRDPSPLVVRRSSNSNLNRRNLRLNLNNGDENIPSGVQKTDSLAVFLKYENELVRGLVDAQNNQENNTLETVSTETTPTIKSSLPTPVTEKDLKDKTNILSKQNSLKNSSSDLQVDKNFNFNYLNNEKELKSSILKPNSNMTDQHHNVNNRNLNSFGSRPRTAETYLSLNKILPIKLDPLPKSIVMKNSISNLSSSKSSSTQSNTQCNNTLAPLSPSSKILSKTNSMNSNKVNLTSIFFNNNNDSKDHNYIDPKLINPCDNLTVTSVDSTDDIKSNWSQESNDTTKMNQNINENLPKRENQNESADLETFSLDIEQLQQDQGQDQLSTCSRNSMMSEKSNKLFKRQIRLGKNQFLYDASPSDSESSPELIDIGQNSNTDNMVNIDRNSNVRQSSKPSTIQTTTLTKNPSPFTCENEFESFLPPSINPIFDNFDFEEFLATFENNNDIDDSFPGLKDCKEFLMNRCLNMRSNNNFSKNLTMFHQYHNNSPCDSIRAQKLEEEQNIENKKRSQNEDEKHEIFISIETDQNENEEPLDVNSCTSDPSIMKNPEVEEINEDKDNSLTDFEIKSIPRNKLIKKSIHENHKTNENGNKNIGNYENLREKTNESNNSDIYPVDSDDVSSVECFPIGRKSIKSKTSSDSAYGSLSRNSPTSADRTTFHRLSGKGQNHLPSPSNISSFEQNESKIAMRENNNHLNASSSGSENSLLRTDNKYLQQQEQNRSSSKDDSINFLHQNFNIKSENNYNIRKDSCSKDSLNDSNDNCNTKPILSKFCYECGSKFLVATAKFCMECGVRRLAIE